MNAVKTQIAEAVKAQGIQAIASGFAQSVIKAWRESIQFGLPQEIFSGNGGPDLENVFGPANQSKTPIGLMDVTEYERKKKAIESFTAKDLHCVNGRLILEPLGTVDLTLSINYVLKAFSRIKDPETGKPILWGYKLRSFDLDEAVMSGIPVDVRNIKANMSVQRDISLFRIFKLMVNFDSSLVFGAKGRYSEEEGKVYINDGNHGTITLVIHGVLTPPVGFTMKEIAWQDANQFIACGGDVLALSEYDLYHCRVTRAKQMKISGVEPKVEDQDSYFLSNLLSKYGFRLVHEARAKHLGPKESHQTANFISHFKNYCEVDNKAFTVDAKLFDLALKTVSYAWPGSPLDHAPVWGLIEFYRCQGIKRINDEFVAAVATVLSEKWNTGTQVWKDVSKEIKRQYPKGSAKSGYNVWKDHRFTNTGNNGLMIAAAIYQLILNRDSAIERPGPDREKGFNLKLMPIVSVGGQSFEMDMPYTGPGCPKNYSVFKPTEQSPKWTFRQVDIIDDDDDNDLASKLDEFEAE